MAKKGRPGQALSMFLGSKRRKYPEAYEALRKSWGGGISVLLRSGYRSREMAMAFTNSKNRYREGYEASEKGSEQP